MPVIISYLALGAALGASAVIALLAPDQVVLVLILLGAAVCLGLGLWIMHREATALAARTQEVIRALPVPAAVFDAQDRLVSCNEPFRARFGEIIAGSADERSTGPTYAEIVAWALAPSGGTGDRDAALNQSLDVGAGESDGLHDREFPELGWLRLGHGALAGGGVVRVALDIDRLKRREVELGAALETATALEDTRAQRFATLSHELRTPLHGVIGMANVMMTDALPARARRNVEVIRRSGRHLLDLINRILVHSEVENAADVPVAASFDIGALVDDVITEIEHAPEAHGLTLDAWFEGDVGRVRLGDRQGLRQVMTNLVGNAVKFTDEGGVSVVVSEPAEGMLRLVVEDTGIGIPEDRQAEIFQAFMQVDSSLTRRHAGTGLGLAISAGLIERMGATMEIESKLGEGSRFVVDLPMPRDGQAGQYREAS